MKVNQEMSATDALYELLSETRFDSNVINTPEFAARFTSLVESGADPSVPIESRGIMRNDAKENALMYFLSAYYEIKNCRRGDYSHVQELIYYLLERDVKVTNYAVMYANFYEDVHMLEELLCRTTEPYIWNEFTPATFAVFESYGAAPSDYVIQ